MRTWAYPYTCANVIIYHNVCKSMVKSWGGGEIYIETATQGVALLWASIGDPPLLTYTRGGVAG